MTNFLQRMRVGDGSFYMHTDGEIDMRSVYCSAVIASLLNVQNHDIFEKSVDWISRYILLVAILKQMFPL